MRRREANPFPCTQDCKYFNAKKQNCEILKKLYCKIEPDKKCSWYKQKTEVEK